MNTFVLILVSLAVARGADRNRRRAHNTPAPTPAATYPTRTHDPTPSPTPLRTNDPTPAPTQAPTPDPTPPPTPSPTPSPTPIPLPARDPSTQCEWFTAGMTWDCACLDNKWQADAPHQKGGIRWDAPLDEKWKRTDWFFTSCTHAGGSCSDARRRKVYAYMCGFDGFGQNGEFGTNRAGQAVRNFGDWDEDSTGVAVFSVRENQNTDPSKATFWDSWMDQREDFNLYGFPLPGQGDAACYHDINSCKCTCLVGANMLGTGVMKALLPYRGPGDFENYKSPGESTSDDHKKMYATYCVGVCGVDCDSAGSNYIGYSCSDRSVQGYPCTDPATGESVDWNSHLNVSPYAWGAEGERMHGKNALYPVLVAHDVCQAYIGSKKSYKKKRGRTNGCGDEAAQNGACYAAEYSMRDFGGGCDTDQQWNGGAGGWCPDWLQGDN